MNIDYTPADERLRLQRLRTLIERSKIYTSILADKLLKQQAEARERGEELDRQKRLEEAKIKKEAAIAAGPTRKSSRAATVEKSEHTTEHLSPKKSRATATTPKGKKKPSGKMNITDYFKKKELDTDLSTKDALKQAQAEMEETDAGITAVTK